MAGCGERWCLDGRCPDGFDCLGQRCRPRACEAPSDCGSPNQTCVDGACAPRPCAASHECDGYCVRGGCHGEQGSCGYPPGTPLP